MDQQALERNVQDYRRLTPEAIAALDEDRHQLAGEEAAALDRVMADPLLRAPISAAIDNLDRRKRASFRLFFLEFPLYAVASLHISFEVIPEPMRKWAPMLLGLAAWLYFGVLRDRLLRLLAGIR